jgi:formate-nitrite transporter family protein
VRGWPAIIGKVSASRLQSEAMEKSPSTAKQIVADPESPISSLSDARKVEERVAIGAKVVYEAVRLEGEDELARPATALAWSGLAAGLSMGFSFFAEAALRALLPDSPWRPAVQATGYCVGFLIVILGRQQLFTENTLTVILPLLVHKNLDTLTKVLKLWSVVLASNIVGTFLFAVTIARFHFLDPAMQQSFMEIAKGHVGAGFGSVLLRAVFAGWLIALMVWMLPDAATSRVVIIIIITYLIGVAGLNHIIAGSANVLYLVAAGQISLGQFFTAFFFPTLIGNILGGVSLVAALAHGQVAGGKD